MSDHPAASTVSPSSRRSRRMLWTILCGVLIVLVVCVGGIVLASTLFTHNPATDVVNKYYTAIQHQNYQQAYTYLDTNTKLDNVEGTHLSSIIFLQVARAIDMQKGKVSSYSITGVQLHTTNGDTMGTCTVNVTRNGQTYTVNLSLHQQDNQWKIVKLDNI